MIRLKQLNKVYYINKKTFVALEDINLSIPQGEIFGILGKSGAGKSTLLRCVNLLEKPTSGQVIINGVDITAQPNATLRQYRHKIGVIFQHFNLLESRNIFDNIALPLEIQGKSTQEIDKKVNSLLSLIDLSDKRYHFPSQLSGGQKQRVGIARALAADPDVLLCDEATSALDTESTKSILHLLKKINREFNLTILLITHELDVVKQICDRVGIMHHGKLIEQDTALNVFAHPKNTITKQLIQQAFHLYTPDQKDKNTMVIKLTFVGKDSEEPLISALVKKFNVTINIKQALVENIQDTTVGFTICQLSGEEAAVQDALSFIKTTSIEVEVLHAAT